MRFLQEPFLDTILQSHPKRLHLHFRSLIFAGRHRVPQSLMQSINQSDMGHQTETVQSKGIYHGLPVFSPDLKDLSAIVVGASGISGRNMLQVLAEAPSRWRKVYALSRRLPDFQGTNTEHVSVDLLKSPEDIAQVLRSAGVRA